VGAVGVGAAVVGVDCDFGGSWAVVCVGAGVGGGGAVGVGGHFGGDVESGDELGWFCGEWRGAESRGVCVLEMSMHVAVERLSVFLNGTIR